MQGPQDQLRGTPFWPFGVLLAVFAVANLVIVPATLEVGPSSDGVLLMGLLMGLIAAQAGLVTLWAAFGSQPWPVRWLATLAAGALLAGALFVGSVLGSGRLPPWEEFWIVALCLPLGFLILQTPLWLFRAITGWQIVPRGGDETSSDARQFGIVDLLGVTAFTAVALGLAQVAFSLGSGGRAETPSELLALVIGFAMWAGLNGLLCLPCLWAVFAARDRAQAVAVLIVWYILFGVGLLAFLTAMSGGGPMGEAVGVMVVFELVDVAALLGGLCLIRAGPYVLLRPRGKRAAADEGTSPFAPGADRGTCPFAPADRAEPSPGESLEAES